MNPEVEIRIVVAIAAVLVLVSMALSLFALRHDAQRRERVGFAWLFATNLAFLIATLGLMANPSLPFWLSAALVISGAHLGIVFGYFAVRYGLDHPPAIRRFTALAVTAIVGQANLALFLDDISVLLLSSSIINGLLGLRMAWRIWPLARGFGSEIATLASLPFAAIGVAYLFRLPLLAFAATPTVVTVATLVITFLLAFSALQWAFALIAFRTARLNARLEAERLRSDEASRLKTRFLANMSHELRTPLNGVMGMAQALHGQVAAGEAQRMVETIRCSADQLMTILNDILDLSKIEAGKLELEAAPFQPAEIVARIARLHGPQAVARGLDFTARSDPALQAAHLGDGHRLAQVLNNLVGNAVKFTEAGRIALEARTEAEGLRITVADTGIGMTEAQMACIFDEFAQADVSITRRFGGTGLGMPIVERLVRMMGGRIDLASAPGKGTTVTLWLPLRPTGNATTTREPTDPGADTGADTGPDAPALAAIPVTAPSPGLRILVAEDNMTNQKVLGALLRDTGFELTFVANGRLAVEAAAAESFDLFLFDVSMPEMDGPSARRTIASDYGRSGRPLPPAAAITANVMPDQIGDYAAAGFADCVAKPVQKAALVATITRLCSSGIDRVA